MEFGKSPFSASPSRALQPQESAGSITNWSGGTDTFGRRHKPERAKSVTYSLFS
jgi:hypothetical protein